MMSEMSQSCQGPTRTDGMNGKSQMSNSTCEIERTGVQGGNHTLRETKQITKKLGLERIECEDYISPDSET